MPQPQCSLKHTRHRHQVWLLHRQGILPHQAAGIRTGGLCPHYPATAFQPYIQFGKIREALLTGILPDAATAILHIFFDYPFLPTRRHVTEIRIEQVIRRQRGKTGIDNPLLDASGLKSTSILGVYDVKPSIVKAAGEK